MSLLNKFLAINIQILPTPDDFERFLNPESDPSRLLSKCRCGSTPNLSLKNWNRIRIKGYHGSLTLLKRHQSPGRQYHSSPLESASMYNLYASCNRLIRSHTTPNGKFDIMNGSAEEKMCFFIHILLKDGPIKKKH